MIQATLFSWSVPRVNVQMGFPTSERPHVAKDGCWSRTESRLGTFYQDRLTLIQRSETETQIGLRMKERMPAFDQTTQPLLGAAVCNLGNCRYLTLNDGMSAVYQ